MKRKEWWENKIEELSSFIKEHGRVPRSKGEENNLYNFLYRSRNQFEKQDMPFGRIKSFLDFLRKNHRFLKEYSYTESNLRLKDALWFVERYGRMPVNRKPEKDRYLLLWRARKEFIDGKMSTKRVKIFKDFAQRYPEYIEIKSRI